MGLFSRNESYGLSAYNNYNIATDESYTYPTGFARILAESAENDMNMFKALIARDFEEAAYIQEGYGGFAPEVLLEGAGDIFNKIKEIFLKLLAKIKGIFKSFMAKFDSVFIKDSKAYYDKYKKVVYGSVKWEGFKAKFSKNKSGKTIESFDGAPIFAKFKEIISETYDSVKFNVFKSQTLKKNPKAFQKNSFDKEKFENEYFEDNKALVLFLNAAGTGLNIDEPSEFKKEFHELYFEDEEEIDDSEMNSIKPRVEAVMTQGEKFGKATKKALDSLDTEVKKVVRELEKIRDENFKNVGKSDLAGSKITYLSNNDSISLDKNDNKYNSNVDTSDLTLKGEYQDKKQNNYDSDHVQTINKTIVQIVTEYASCTYTLSTIMQTAVTTAHNAFLEELKFEATQCRKFFAAMVAHAMKGKNKIVADNSSALLYIAQEAAEYEINSDFELA